MVEGDPVADDLLGVVFAAFLGGSAQEPRHDRLVVRRDLQDDVESGAAPGQHGVETGHLVEIAGVSVQQEAPGGVGLVEARLDHAIRHFVGHELAAGREGVREPAEFVARLGVGAEDRPRGDGGDAELAGDRLGLGSLARTGGTDEDHSYRH